MLPSSTSTARHQKSEVNCAKRALGPAGGKTYTKFLGRHMHRVVAELMLGRPLKSDEVVHHIDGDKRNNRPENLMVFSSQKEHAAFHAAQKKEGGCV